MQTNQMTNESNTGLSGIALPEHDPNIECGISSYKDLSFDLARICCRIACAIANRDQKGITQIKWRMHQRELKRALKEQHEIVTAIFQNESNIFA